jgi:hypothetical protein
MAQWTCPKCKRKFAKINQSHSCRVYPLSNHFKGKESSKELYDELIKKMKSIGKFRVDSVQCCIHLVKEFAFLGVYIMKDKIRVSFYLNRKIESKRIFKSAQISKKRFSYLININSKEEIDKELINWIKESYEK